MKHCVCANLCPTSCDPMDCNLPGSSVYGISQARILELVAISYSRGYSWPRESNPHLLNLLHWQVGVGMVVLYHEHHQAGTFIIIPWIDVAEAGTPILWPPDAKNWLTKKDPDDGKDWRREEKGTTEDEMVGWHYRLNGHEFEQAPGVGDGQGSLAYCSPWGRKESDVTERLNWTGRCEKWGLEWRINLPVR